MSDGVMYALFTVLAGVLIGAVIASVVNIRRLKAAVRSLERRVSDQETRGKGDQETRGNGSADA